MSDVEEKIYQISVQRALACGSFAIFIAAQTYATLTTPNIQEVTEANYYAFSPNTHFIIVFFALYVFLQLVFIRDLFLVREDAQHPTWSERIAWALFRPTDDEDFGRPEACHIVYPLWYAIGNACLATWLVFWTWEWFWLAFTVATVNLLIQLFSGFVVLGPFGFEHCTPNEPAVHFVSKPLGGISLILFLDNLAVAMKYPGPPSAIPQIIMLWVLARMGSTSDYLFDFGVLYGVVALCVGQPTWWPTLALTIAVIIWRLYSDASALQLPEELK